MSDNLTQKLKRELEKRGQVASDAQIEEAIALYRQRKTTPSLTSFEGIQTAEPETNNLDLLNAVGVGLYTALDTATFGATGLVLDKTGVDLEDIGLDLEQEGIAATIARAGGGFAGFVAGVPFAPLRVGMATSRGAVKLAKGLGGLKGKTLSGDVAKTLKSEIKQVSGNKAVAKELSKQYKASAQNANIRWNDYRPKFIENTKAQLKRTLDDIPNEALTLSQKQKIKDVIEDNITDIPIQDVMSVIKSRFGADTKLARYFARAANDAVAFGTTDTIFEAVRSQGYGDDFDYFAPAFGVITGTLFGFTEALGPAGTPKGTFKRDLIQGIRSSFSRNPFKNYDSDKLLATAKFYGTVDAKNLGKNPTMHRTTIEHGGKQVKVNLSSDDLKDTLDANFVEGWENVLRTHLTKKRKQFGKEIIGFAVKEESQSLAEQFPRLMVGGVAFNAHLFRDIGSLEASDLYSADTITNFLIGAFVERGQRPRSKDFNFDQDTANRLRSNLASLEIDVNKISYMPSLYPEPSRFEENRTIAELKDLDSELENRNIVSKDNAEAIEAPLPEGTETATREGNPLFATFLENSTGLKRKLENISKEDADYFEAQLQKLGINSDEQFVNFIDEKQYDSTKDFESIIDNLIANVQSVDNNNVLKFDYNIGNEKDSALPRSVQIDQTLYDKAERGELLFLNLKGEEAFHALNDAIGGLNALLEIKTTTNKTVNLNKVIDDRTVFIKDEALLKDVYTEIVDAQKNVETQYPTNSNKTLPFSFRQSQIDYVPLLLSNKTVKLADNYTKIFSPQSENRNVLAKFMKESGLLVDSDSKIGLSIINDLDSINLVGGDDIQNSADRRFLARVHALQKFSLGYDGVESTRSIDVTPEQVNGLRNKLKELGYSDTLPNWLQNDVVGKILQKQASKMDLSIEQLNGVIELIDTPFAKFTSKAVGDVGGFTLNTIDLDSPISIKDDIVKGKIVEYNKIVTEIRKKGKGVIKGESVLVHDPDGFSEAYRVMQNIQNATGKSAVESVQAFISAIGSNYRTIEFRTKTFLDESVNNKNILNNWLLKTGIVSFKDNIKSGSKFSVDLKLLDEVKQKELLEVYDKQGVTEEYGERIYQEHRQYILDKYHEFPDVVKSDRNMTVEQFWKKYRTTKDEPVFENSRQQIDTFNALFKIDENFDINETSVKEAIDMLYVENSNGKYVKFSSLRGKEASRAFTDFTQDIIGLIEVRTQTRQIDQIKFDNENVKVDKTHIYKNRFHDFLHIDLGINYSLVNPVGIKYTGWSRVARNLYASQDLPDIIAKQNEAERQLFISRLSSMGMEVFHISQDAEPIAVRRTELENLHAPFVKLSETYKGKFNPNVEKRVNSILTKIDSQTNPDVAMQIPTPAEYETMFRMLTFENMMTGKDGSDFYVDFINNNVKDLEKTLSRFKLYNTKKFVRAENNVLENAIFLNKKVKSNKETLRVLEKYKSKNNKDGAFDIVIWDDEANDNVIKEAKKLAKENGIDFDANTILGDAHNKVSAYDSISFVSKDLMRFFHTIVGHKSDSLNPLKPVISSDVNSSVLFGKTLFVYDSSVDPFFKRNPKVDILLAKSGAKIFNNESAVIQSSISEISTGKIPVTNDLIKKLSLESIGVLPSKDTNVADASRSQSENNFKNPKEEIDTYNAEYEAELQNALDNIENIMKDPIRIREFMVMTDADLSMPIDNDGRSSLSYLHGHHYWNSLTRDANPLYYDKSKVYNKLYNHFINPVLERKRAVLSNGDRYGGQAYLAQTPSSRLQGTITNVNGEIIQRGEIMLPHSERNNSLEQLSKEGYELSFVDNSDGTSKVLRIDDIINEIQSFSKTKDREFNKDLVKKTMQEFTLGDLHDTISGFAKESGKRIQVGVVVNRKPRTRPNDMAMLGIKGFVTKGDGHKAIVNSLDVVNIFEGDYDADKADYYFANKKSTIDHVERSSSFFVQGIDPANYFVHKENFTFEMTPTQQSESMRKMLSANYAWKNAIGKVQKIPRGLGFIEKLSSGDTPNNIPDTKTTNNKSYKPRTLMKYNDGNDIIVLDFDNVDFKTRMALETQYMIDETGNINKELGEDLTTIQDDFLFPSKDNSYSVNNLTDARQRKIMKSGTDSGKRIRIFKKYKIEDGEYVEKDLTDIDKEVVRTLLREYSKFLNITGGTTFDNTGVQKQSRYEDIVETSSDFFKFNSNINDNIYYKLRNKKLGGKKLSSRKDFNDMFGVETKYKVYENGKFVGIRPEPSSKEKSSSFVFYKPSKNIFDDKVLEHATAISDGRRGSVIDMAINKIVRNDVFNANVPVDLTTGGRRKDFDDWYNQLTDNDRTTDFNSTTKEYELTYSDKILNEIKDVHKSIAFIKQNKYYKSRLFYNKKLTYKERGRRMDYFDSLINKERKKIDDFIVKSKDGKALLKDIDYIKFNPIDSAELIEANVQHAVMSSVKQALNVGLGADKIILSKDGKKLLDDLLTLRRNFYHHSNNGLKDFLSNKKSALDSETSKYLSDFPEATDIYEVERLLLERGIGGKDGLKFLYAYMEPTYDRGGVGVFQNRIVPAPRYTSARFRSGLRFISQKAQAVEGNNLLSALDSQDGKQYKEIARLFQGLINHFDNFYHLRFDRRDVIDKGNYTPEEISLIQESKLPLFNKYLDKRVLDFNGINWGRVKNQISTGRDLTNNHLMDFYQDIMQLAGKTEEFNVYAQTMGEIQSDMLKADIIDPFRYLSIKAQMEPEVKKLAQKVITSSVMKDLNNPVVQSILQNPIYNLMGGESFFKGISFEKQPQQSLKDLSRVNEALDYTKTVEDQPVFTGKSEESANKVERLLEECRI